MKKIVCLILFLTILTTSFAGCGGNTVHSPDNNNQEQSGNHPRPDDPGNQQGSTVSISGIDAAKLLLAEERLNEKLLKNDGDIFENGVKVMQTLAARAKDNLGARVLSGNASVSSPAALSANSGIAPRGGSAITALDKDTSTTTREGSLGDEKGGIGNMRVDGDTVIWTDFDEVSNSYEYFLNLTNNIVSEAERCANLIDFAKKNIRIVDKWVNFGNESYYLSVGENEELLCNANGSGDTLFLIVCRRYRNEEGKDVYEMYSSYGSDYERRMTYVPGERYEFSENRIQHFIATNTKGYWENYVLGDAGTHYNVSYLILKDDICYTFGFLNPDYTAINILSADRQTDLFHYTIYDGEVTLNLALNGFVNIEKITADKTDTAFSPSEDYAYVQWNSDAKLHITNGNIIEENAYYADGKVLVSGIMVMYMAYGYSSEMMLNISGSPDEAMEYFKQFLDETGLSCSRDIDTVLAATEKSIADSRAVFNYYQWNGYTVNTEAGIRKATDAENTKYDEIIALYENVKNAESVTFTHADSEEMQRLMSFAPIISNLSSGARLTGGTLIIDSLTLTVNDVSLFVKDEPYHVVVALEDSTGAIVHLEQSPSGELKYAEEKEFSVSANGLEITLPSITPGSYRVVAYIATSEGIRSSKFSAIAFEATNEEPISLSSVDLMGNLDPDQILTLTYVERIDVNARLESDTVLSYGEFRQLICEEAFKYGIPNEASIEMLGGEGYAALTGSETEIADGSYRVEYSIENGDYTRSGYVYVDYLVRSEQPEEDAPVENPEQPVDADTVLSDQ